jgi:glyoxylase-like metal-dependent hydrolase (beta-lactamase superfamily II)
MITVTPNPTRLPLEDGVRDIIGKAQKGLNCTLPAEPWTPETYRTIAATLRLGPEALLASANRSWYPSNPGSINGLMCFTTPFEDFTVNSYVVFDPISKQAAAFDTGSRCDGMINAGVRISQIFLTHIHADHIMALDELRARTRARPYVSEREPIPDAEPFKDGDVFSTGRLQVETRRTSGHARGGTTYVVTGLAKQLAIVGDAIFAGSIGGGVVNYAEALRTTRDNILSLSDDTVICPGHGPLTTVGEEKRHNPFFT